MHNETEEAKLEYKSLVDKNGNSERKEVVNKNPIQSSSKSRTSPTEENVAEGLEDDLDFLLALNEPVGPSISSGTFDINSSDERSQSKPGEVKSIDLEEWLDSVLDD